MRIIRPRLDHVALWAPDLAAGAAAFGARFGVKVHPGGAHPGQGTRNALAGGPQNTYLELLSSDPDQPEGGPLARRFASAEPFTPCLVAFASDDLDALAHRAAATGLTCDGPKSMERRTPNGVLRWRLLFLFAQRWPCLPFFIDWGETPHPSLALPGGLSELAVSFCDPDPAQMTHMFRRLGLNLCALDADAQGLEVRLQGPRESVAWRSVLGSDGAWRCLAINP